MTFKNKLKEARIIRQLSQTDLAHKSGLQPAAINHFESGRRTPSFDNLIKLVDALDISADFLFDRISPSNSFQRRYNNLSDKNKALLNDFIAILEKPEPD